MKLHVDLPVVDMEGHPIPEPSSIKLLWININNNMSCNDHVAGIVRLPLKLESKQASSPTTRTETESIKVKIRKANMLIDRVKEALDGIKFKEKGGSTTSTSTEQEQSTHPNTETTDSDKENSCCFIIQQSKAQLEAQMKALETGTASKPISAKTTADLDPSRPKTRRCDCSEDEHDVEERYRTTPSTRTPAVSRIDPDNTSSDETEDNLQLLKAKLNAISEQTTESESEKLPATCTTACNTLAIQTTTTATNTESPSMMCTRESQWSPCGMPKGTQSFTPAAEKSLQTDQQKKVLLTRCTVENAAIPPKCSQAKNLVIQSLPPIEVKFHHRRMQSLLHFSIENNETTLLFKNETCNVAFQLAKSPDFTDDQKPVETERGKSLLKIIEKGRKMRSSVDVAEMETPRVARRILDLEYPEEDIASSEEEVEEPLESGDGQDSRPPKVIADLNKKLWTANTKRSISQVIEEKGDSEAYLFTNKIPEKTSDLQTVSESKIQSSDREKVLRSYHVYDNINAHDPGVLSNSSLNLISKVDENVYKTYINPSGFQLPPSYQKSNTLLSRTNSAKKCGLSDIFSFTTKKSRSRSRDPEGNLIQGAVPKIWSLGFYANKSTQVDSPSGNQSIFVPNTAESSRVQDEEILAAGEERALKVISFTNNVSRFKLTNEEDDHPARLQAEKDDGSAYQLIGCDGRCSQWAADLRTAITSIREPREELEMKKDITKKATKGIQKETKKAACSCRATNSKLGVQDSQKQETITYDRESQKLSNSSDHPTSREHNSEKNTETTKKAEEAKENEEHNGGSDSNIRTEKHASPKQSGRAEDGSQATLVEYRTMNGSQLETISLTVSYSADDSVEVNSPGMQNTTKTSHTSVSQESTKSETLIPRQKSELKTKLQFNKSVNQLTEEGKVVLRGLKDKLETQHAEQSKASDNIELQSGEEKLDRIDSSEEVSNFICGLTQRSSEELKKVIPIIRSQKALGKAPQEKTKQKRTYDVNYVFGDSCQPKVAELSIRKSSKQNEDPLKVAGNGRYKDEAQLFTKFVEQLGRSSKPKTLSTKQAVASLAHEKPEPQIARRMAKHAGRHKHKRKNNFKLETTSNSETITTERSKSEGELTSCQCAVSNGELHSCRYDRFHLRNPPIFNDAEDLVTTIRKKRSYFNNCVTYYLKRTPVPGPPHSSNRCLQQQLNDSSISTNTVT